MSLWHFLLQYHVQGSAAVLFSCKCALTDSHHWNVPHASVTSKILSPGHHLFWITMLCYKSHTLYQGVLNSFPDVYICNHHTTRSGRRLIGQRALTFSQRLKEHDGTPGGFEQTTFYLVPKSTKKNWCFNDRRCKHQILIWFSFLYIFVWNGWSFKKIMALFLKNIAYVQ